MRWKIWSLAGLLLASAVAGLGFAWPFGKRPDVIQLPGIVEIHEVLLGPRVAGRVKEVHVTEADTLSEGMPLVTLETPELEAQREVLRAKVKEAEAELAKAVAGPRSEEIEAATAAVEAARARWLKCKNGFREEEKRQAKSELEAALADEQYAREEFQRAARLVRQGGTKQDYDNWKATLDRAKGRVAAARARYDLMLAGSREEDLAEAQAELRRLEANERLLRAGTRPEDLASAKARLAEARGRLQELEVHLREAVVRAAEPCLVEVVHVRKGALVQAGQPVARVLRTADLWVKTYVPETELGKIRLGQEVQVTMDSYPGMRFPGRIVLIGAESEFTPRNVQTVDERRHQMFGLRVKIDDPKGHFKSGMAAEVYIPVLKD